MLSVLCSRKGSITAVEGSGSRIMSDSWICWKPRIDEPSNPYPSLNVSSVSSCTGIGEVLHQTGKIAEPEIDDLDPLVLHETKDLGSACALAC